MKERMEADNAVRRSMLLTEKERNYSESELQSIFMNIAQAKLDIINIQQNKYSRISHSLKKSLDSKNAELWQAIKDIDYDKVKELTKEKSYDSIIIPIISFVIYKKESTWSLSDKEKIVVDILNQAYTAYPYGYIKVTLDDTGINSYISDKELSKIDHKVSVSLDI